jgi:serine/threonine protein kinase
MNGDKTLRSPSTTDVEKTLRQPEEQTDKTLRSPAPDLDKTLRQTSGDGNKTMRMSLSDKKDDLDKTKAINQQHSDGGVVNPKGEQSTYELNGKTYAFKKIISEHTGEAQIYLVEREGNAYILKLYYPQFKPRMALFEKLKSFDFPGMIKLYEYGEWTSPKTGSKRTFELMEYLEGGELDKIKFAGNADKLREIAIQAAHSLTFCHNNNIIHKDVKPGNFFFRDKKHKQLVLGDFGIASLCEEDELMHQTQQARTPIYAAPEMYITIDDKIEINGKVDFYSLGIMLMYVWLGDNPFKGNERAMTNMKRFGELPYPEDVPSDILTLMKGLTVVNPEKRWGFDEVQRWYNGESVAVARNTLARYKPFVFDADQNLAANNPQELAELMDKYPQLAIKYLYGNHIKNWLEESANNKLAVEVYEICEKRHPKNQTAGLRATIYLFNSKIVYKSVDGKECENNAQMAAAILKNLSHYRKALQSKDDDYYIYLNASGKTKQRNQFLNYFKTYDSKVAIWKIIYYLDRTTPFFLQVKQSKRKTTYLTCKTPDEIIVGFRENDPTDDGWQSFVDGRFLSWYENQFDPDTYEILEKILSDDSVYLSEKVHAIMFYINRQVSINLYLPGENDNYYFFTKSDVGNLYNHYARNRFQFQQEDSFADMCIDRLTEKNSIMYFYFESKGWHEEVRWVKYCFELNKGDNRKKCGPYNQEVALYKAIKGLDFEPYYYFPKNEKSIYTLEELKEIPSEEIIDELDNGSLKSWLTLFYQEAPTANLRTQYAYENLTKEYTLKLAELDCENPEALRFKDAIKRTESLRKKVKRRFTALSVMKLLFAILFLVPAGFLLAWLFIYKIPLTDNPLPGAFWKVSWIYYALAGISLGLYTWGANDNEGFITSMFAGLIEAVILYYVIYIIVALLFPFLSILAIVLAIGGVIGFIWAAYGAPSSSRSLRKELFVKSDPATSFIEPLYHAFHPSNNGFKSSKHDALLNFGEDLARQRSKLTRWIIPGIIIFALSSGAYFFLHPHFSTNPIRRDLLVKAGLQMGDDQKNKILGTWKGNFDNRTSVLTIEEINSDSDIKGNIGVQFNNYIVEGFSGSFSNRKNLLQFKDTTRNKLLDGDYRATFNAQMDTLTGNYKSRITGKIIPFTYVRSN